MGTTWGQSKGLPDPSLQTADTEQAHSSAFPDIFQPQMILAQWCPVTRGLLLSVNWHNFLSHIFCLLPFTSIQMFSFPLDALISHPVQ